jgi:plasmid maintenance system antidote protein VapI
MRTNMTQIANKAGVTRRYIDYLLSAESDASPRVAVRLEKVTGISRQVWTFGTKRQRQDAWKRFKMSQQ